MKRMLIIFCGLAALVAGAAGARAQDALESQFSPRLEKLALLSLNDVKANEIVKGNVVHSGIVVHVWKTDNLFQLMNPFAPDRYGSAEDNTLRDAITERASGWKIFSIRF